MMGFKSIKLDQKNTFNMIPYKVQTNYMFNGENIDYL